MATLILTGASAHAGDFIRVPGGEVEMTLGGKTSEDFRKLAIEWTQTSARSVSAYYGAFPIKKVRLQITPAGGTGAGDGVANGWNGALITISFGRASTRKDIRTDWQLTHEMVHLAFPNVDEKHHWIEEGLATYVEPIARSASGSDHAAGSLVRFRGWHAPGAAKNRRSWSGYYSHLGTDLLGRRALLSASGC